MGVQVSERLEDSIELNWENGRFQISIITTFLFQKRHFLSRHGMHTDIQEASELQ
jgi:hypothetical protein